MSEPTLPVENVTIDWGDEINAYLVWLRDKVAVLEADNGAYYVLPGTGIPITDLADAVETLINGAVQASTVNAKGDLLVGTADNTLTRLGLGTTGQVLAVDTAEATGVKWSGTAATVHTHVIADTTTLQTELDDLNSALSSKSDTSHTHTSANISGTLTLEQLPPNAVFVINWVSSAWKYNGATITTRPSSRSDLRMWAVGGTTPPGFALTHDMHSPEVA